MKTFYIAVFCAALGLNSAACTSSTESTGKAEKKTAINAQTTSAPTAQQANAANSDTAAVTENVNAVLNPMDQAKQKKADALRRQGANEPVEKVDLEVLLQRSARPAPENSVFSAVLTDIVFERRTFKNHSQIAKVEKVSDGNKKTVKVFLRDGNVIELPGERIEFLSTVSSADLLAAIGLKAPPPPAKKQKPLRETKSAS